MSQVFWLSVWQGRATPGSELLNLRYRDERKAARRPEVGGGPERLQPSEPAFWFLRVLVCVLLPWRRGWGWGWGAPASRATHVMR